MHSRAVPAHAHEECGEGDLLVVQSFEYAQWCVINDVIQVHLVAVLCCDPAADETDLLQLGRANADQFVDQRGEGGLGDQADRLGKLQNVMIKEEIHGGSVYKSCGTHMLFLCNMQTSD